MVVYNNRNVASYSQLWRSISLVLIYHYIGLFSSESFSKHTQKHRTLRFRAVHYSKSLHHYNTVLLRSYLTCSRWKWIADLVAYWRISTFLSKCEKKRNMNRTIRYMLMYTYLRKLKVSYNWLQFSLNVKCNIIQMTLFWRETRRFSLDLD